MKYIYFFRFLAKYNVLEEFKYNFKNSNYSGYLVLTDYFNKTSSYSWILHAFDWLQTPENNSTWAQLHYDWSICIKDIDSFELNKNIRIL